MTTGWPRTAGGKGVPIGGGEAEPQKTLNDVVFEAAPAVAVTLEMPLVPDGAMYVNVALPPAVVVVVGVTTPKFVDI